MNIRVWYSTESFADYVIENTTLRHHNIEKRKMYESDANNPTNFHSLPDHIKQILYLDAPDLIVEKDLEPIFSVEISREAGTGHNAFQRFARLAASIEKGVPAFYIYPEAAIVTRSGASPVWDKINPLIFKALIEAINIYDIPALLYYHPSDYSSFPTSPASAPHLSAKGLKNSTASRFLACPDETDTEMVHMFEAMNEIVNMVAIHGVIDARKRAKSNRIISSRISFMQHEYHSKVGTRSWSPMTATITVSTDYLINYLSAFHSSSYQIGDLLRSRAETVIYKVDAGFRGDPYPGALAALDYLMCRQGQTFEDRRYNLVLAWGDVSIDTASETVVINQGNNDGIDAFCNQVMSSEQRSNVLQKSYSQLNNHEIPRYYMQVRYGSMFSKVKHIRVFSYFADAILFYDGALWRDG